MKKSNVLRTSTQRVVNGIAICLFATTLSCTTDVLLQEEQQEANEVLDEASKATCLKPYTWLQQSGNSANWKLQYASSSSTFEAKRTSSNNFKTIANDRFDMVGSACNRLRFKVNGNDATTSGSNNPRCELREMTKQSNGKENEAAWNSNTTSTKRLTVKPRVLELTNTNKVGVAQYHSDDDEIVIVTVQKVGTKYTLKVEGDGISSTSHQTLTTNYTLGTEFTISIEVNNNRVRWKYNSGSYTSWKSIVNNTNYRRSTTYFKAGAYALNSPTSGACRVEFSQVLVNSSQEYYQ